MVGIDGHRQEKQQGKERLDHDWRSAEVSSDGAQGDEERGFLEC